MVAHNECGEGCTRDWYLDEEIGSKYLFVHTNLGLFVVSPSWVSWRGDGWILFNWHPCPFDIEVHRLQLVCMYGDDGEKAEYLQAVDHQCAIPALSEHNWMYVLRGHDHLFDEKWASDGQHTPTTVIEVEE